MSVDESKKVDQARQDRLQDMAKGRVRPRPQETEFDKILERSRMIQQPTLQQQQQTKTLTEDAIREAARRQEREQDRQRDGEEKKEGRDQRGKGERADSKGVVEQKVVAKGRLKQGSDGGSGGSREGFGSGAGTGRRELTKSLSRAGVRSLPVDLQGKFAARLTNALKQQALRETGFSQQVLNKIVQFVRIGINRKGEKEIQLDLSERIYKGLKLRVIASGGKVNIHFKTTDPKGRKVFEEGKEAIRDALTKKGIEVDEITIS